MAPDAGLYAIGTRFRCRSLFEADFGIYPHERFRCKGSDPARDGR